jgi:hypothetical protein
VAKRYLPLAEDGRIMRAFAKIAIAVAFVSAIVWFGHHSRPHNYSYAALHDADVRHVGLPALNPSPE